ncbi:hypothetical protein DFH08DRAFT_978818 [Mycena albidolilacea]|uniref:Uncharacterized protein n=1 Tax=Mycena albidolilacea TaxID=1033008 RepID=A0AAD7E7Q0_9AGAR|nr:hypothetical protein DFH08DRAFT_978818 [Mycena albidolilacea]
MSEPLHSLHTSSLATCLGSLHPLTHAHAHVHAACLHAVCALLHYLRALTAPVLSPPLRSQPLPMLFNPYLRLGADGHHLHLTPPRALSVLVTSSCLRLSRLPALTSPLIPLAAARRFDADACLLHHLRALTTPALLPPPRSHHPRTLTCRLCVLIHACAWVPMHPACISLLPAAPFPSWSLARVSAPPACLL